MRIRERTAPRTIFLNLARSVSIRLERYIAPALVLGLTFFQVASGKDRGYKIEYVRGAGLTVSIVLDHPMFDDVDLFLGVMIDDL